MQYGSVNPPCITAPCGIILLSQTAIASPRIGRPALPPEMNVNLALRVLLPPATKNSSGAKRFYPLHPRTEGRSMIGDISEDRLWTRFH
jgi:hypothetical protein